MDLATYQQMLAAATVLERDAYGEKVLTLPDGNLVKIFRRKRWLSSALLRPYALRFAGNAKRLAAKTIPTVTVLDVCYCRAMRRHLVTYRPLPGVTLRSMLRDCPAEQAELLQKLADFIAQLHRSGVYFRSVHFGNIIVMPIQNQLGLIDVADMTVRRKPICISERIRNFRHMLRYAEDVGFLREFGWARFIDRYLEAMPLPPDQRRMLGDSLQPLVK